MTTPEMQKIRARDVVPYHWGVWCSIADGQPFTNAIELVRWSDDGQHLWFLLGTHNFYKAAPDEEIDLVPLEPGLSPQYLEKVKLEHAETIAKRPVPTVPCASCAGAGKVPAVPTGGGDT